jgi:hypothetical protein
MDIRDLLLISTLLSANSKYKFDMNDVKYHLDENVGTCELRLYIEIIKMISEGTSYDEIFDYIDKYSSLEYQELLEDQKSYVKAKVKNTLNQRIERERNDKYE